MKQNLIRATELIGKALEPNRLQQPEFVFTKRQELVNHMLVGGGDSCQSSHLHSICISAVHNSPYSMFHSFHELMNSINWPACHFMGIHSSAGRALQRVRRGHGSESH